MFVPLIDFKKASNTDLDAIIDIYQRCIHHNFKPVLGEAFAKSQENEEELLDFLLEQLANTYLMLIDESISAFAIVEEDEIKMIMMEPEKQQQAYGAFFLEHLENQRKENIDQFYIRLPKALDYSINFFQHLGYEIVSEYQEEEMEWVECNKKF
ncbi:GNAT family N-acetyltransferase [Persicobacter sp. CCB-QB2]|uniref:GNAT family N-acetyltransferase n=1 Tax=Persicobacter sp. CCB-QB2 TaxID=1561025 RepID=UPI0006A9BDA1|nr:GNAT family N-acetyltransferase [Persicobacter sp. CCB-QB2]